MQVQQSLGLTEKIAGAAKAVLEGVKWLGRTIVNLTSGAATTTGKGLKAIISVLKTVWEQVSPALSSIFGFLKSRLGLFVSAMGISTFCLSKSFTLEKLPHRIAFGGLSIISAVAAGAIGSQTGIIPQFL